MSVSYTHLLRHKVYTAEMDTLAVKKQAMQLAQQSYLLRCV